MFWLFVLFFLFLSLSPTRSSEIVECIKSTRESMRFAIQMISYSTQNEWEKTHFLLYLQKQMTVNGNRVMTDGMPSGCIVQNTMLWTDKRRKKWLHSKRLPPEWFEILHYYSQQHLLFMQLVIVGALWSFLSLSASSYRFLNYQCLPFATCFFKTGKNEKQPLAKFLGYFLRIGIIVNTLNIVHFSN